MRLRNSLMCFTLMGALACAVFGAEEYRLKTQSSQEPEEISLRDLIKRGPEGNPNIMLKDFALVEDYIYQKKLLSGRWTKVWVPIVPASPDKDVSGKPAAIHAFFYSENVGSDEEVRRRFDKPRLHGMVNLNGSKPGIRGSILIKRSYPGTDPSQCLIIEEGRKPAGTLKLALFGVGCVLLIGLSGGIWYLARLLDKVEVESAPADRNDSRERKHGSGVKPIHVAELDDDAEPRPPLS
jgi:hypothetical protein